MAADPIPDARARAAAPERAIEPVAVASDAGGAGVERSPGPLERGDVEQPGQVQPEHDEDDPADRAQGRQVVDQGPGHEGGHDAEEREDRTEPGHVRDGVADRQPARRRDAAADPPTAIAVSWPT